jgi:hypothetical protein
MAPSLVLKDEHRSRRRGRSEISAADIWSSPGVDFKKPRRRVKRGWHNYRDTSKTGATFRSPSLPNDEVISKIQGRLGIQAPDEARMLVVFPVKGQAVAAVETSAPNAIDRAASEVKRLARSEQPSDEDFIRVARALREAIKSELYSDPPMADLCLVVADALTFTSAADLRPSALAVLSNALGALAKPKADQNDRRSVFSELIRAGWRVTPAYDEDELAAWVEQMGS